MYERVSKEEKDLIPITAGVFIFDSDKLNYVYGGTYSWYMSFMAPYLMQINMINIAIENHLDKYDFGGITGTFERVTPNFGVYEFKRGFGGHVVEYVGEFDLILNEIFYKLYVDSLKIYRNIKKLKL